MVNQFVTTRRTLLQGGAVGALALGAPAVLRSQDGPIRIGHLTPRTGFLGPLGEYAAMAAEMAVDEVNAAGGINGREVEILLEDSVNPQTASTKAERMVERDGVACIVGEISSASCLTISQVAQRTGTLFVNTGGNSDALRGSDCKRMMFHIEHQNSMYVKSIGQYYVKQGLVDGKRWYSLTADYAFGHDLLGVAKRFMAGNGGSFAGDELVPTDATDFSAYLLQIRAAEPDLVILNLAGQQTTNFFKQYGEFGMDFPLGGFGFDMALAWAAGAQDFRGSWPSVWSHRVPTDGSRKFVEAFTARFGKPPENQAWGDYNAIHIIANSMNALGTTDSMALVEHFEKGTEFDVMKSRPGYFRASDHQFISEMYAVTAIPAGEAANQWDIFTVSDPVPGPGEDMESIAATAEENACTFDA